jgi:hypothetical protein
MGAMRLLPWFVLLLVSLAHAQEPRPAAEGAQEGARSLLAAIVRDDPALADAFFFPRDAFTQVKAIAKPERYWDKLHERFQRDVHALHKVVPAGAEFVRLELTARGGYVKPGEEGNRLPYWAARHAWLHYRAGAQQHKLELRVLISWQQRWYLIHLSEFH